MTVPDGSKVRLGMERGYESIIMPHGKGGVMRYFMGLFLIVWLGGWTLGWIGAFVSIISTSSKGVNAFLIFWLVAWTVGGGFAFWYLFRLLRPSVPEVLVLTMPTLWYDTGIAPFAMSFDYRAQMDIWKKLFKKRCQMEFSPAQIQTLRLRDYESGNRLTIDHGAERIELGVSLTEVEREWLYFALVEKYRLTPEQQNIVT